MASQCWNLVEGVFFKATSFSQININPILDSILHLQVWEGYSDWVEYLQLAFGQVIIVCSYMCFLFSSDFPIDAPPLHRLSLFIIPGSVHGFLESWFIFGASTYFNIPSFLLEIWINLNFYFYLYDFRLPYICIFNNPNKISKLSTKSNC